MKKQILNKQNIYYILIFVIVTILAILGLSSSPLNKGVILMYNATNLSRG